jgi:small subunit ribosomal protein S7
MPGKEKTEKKVKRVKKIKKKKTEEIKKEEKKQQKKPKKEKTKEAKVKEEKVEEKPVEVEGASQFLIFGKYDVSEVVISDAGLSRYLNLNPIAIPHTGAKFANKRFGKAKVSIVERLINNMMRTENFTGKKMKTYKAVRNAFEIIHKKTKKNPLQVLVDALQNAAPREEITRLRFGGISVPKAVDIAPLRRLDTALRNISKGAVKSTYKNKKPIERCLADEIIMASNKEMNSFSISKKEEIERIASSAR